MKQKKYSKLSQDFVYIYIYIYIYIYCSLFNKRKVNMLK